VGVYDRALLAPLAAALRELGAERALVVHGADGLDEITVTGPTFAVELAGGRLAERVIEPGALGIPLAKAEDLRGGDAAENAALVRGVLAGEPGPRRDVVAINAAAALVVAEAAPDLAQGLRMAWHSIDSGAAAARLDALVRASAARAA
jgi:anthranilate phosphoribosyltransferase